MFRKFTAVAMGSLLAFSGTAFANTEQITEISHESRLGNVDIIVAQDQLCPQGSLRNIPVFARSIANSETTLGNALSVFHSEAIRGIQKGIVFDLITKAKSLIYQAYILSCSNNISDKKEAAKLLAEAEMLLGNALNIVQSDAISGPGKPAIAQSLASAKTAIGNATIITQSQTR